MCRKSDSSGGRKKKILCVAQHGGEADPGLSRSPVALTWLRQVSDGQASGQESDGQASGQVSDGQASGQESDGQASGQESDDQAVIHSGKVVGPIWLPCLLVSAEGELSVFFVQHLINAELAANCLRPTNHWHLTFHCWSIGDAQFIETKSPTFPQLSGIFIFTCSSTRFWIWIRTKWKIGVCRGSCACCNWAGPPALGLVITILIECLSV